MGGTLHASKPRVCHCFEGFVSRGSAAVDVTSGLGRRFVGVGIYVHPVGIRYFNMPLTPFL